MYVIRNRKRGRGARKIRGGKNQNRNSLPFKAPD